MTASDDRRAALCVLGSISVNVDGRPVPLGGEKQRRLLAVLVLNRNAALATHRLVEVMWGDDPPDTAVATLQSYVSRLRRLLPPAVRLTGEAPGYRLVVEPGATDIDRFETALDQALDLDGDPDADPGGALDDDRRSPSSVLARIDEALAQWQGDAVAEFAQEWWARAEVARLSELHLHAHETRLAALLALGLDERAAAEADALTIEHPWRERPVRALMLALYRAGRQGEALQRAADFRMRLRDELGLDPSAELDTLERDVATDAPRLGRAAPSPERNTSLGAPGRPISPATTPAPAPAPDAIIGRDDDLTKIIALTERSRLVTLVGPGGIGKTRLAYGVAAGLGVRQSLRSEMVELARVRDEDNVVAAVATQLDVQPQQGRSTTESVLDLLGDRPLLLVLDNCEHVLDTIAGFVERLLYTCPAVRVLATSREPLGLPAESVFKVPALAVADERADLDVAVASPAVALFVARARAANPDFVLDASTARAVAGLCRRLDGVPLALELAAARTRSLSPSEITERLGDRFTLLAGSSRVSDARHRSLRDLVDWSYQLLEPPARQLFRRLSIFAGYFDLRSAERVCGYGEIPAHSVAPVLASLVDKSMVQASTGPQTTYRLLETLREYGAALDDGEGPGLARRHGAWILDISEEAAAGLGGPEEGNRLDLFDRVFDDIRLAVRNTLEIADLDTALRIVVAAREHAFRRLHYELIGWAEAALALEQAAGHPLAAAALGIVAYGRFVRGEIDAAIDLGERARELARRTGTDTLGLAERALGNAYVFRGDAQRSTAAIDQLVAGAASAGDDARIAHAYYMRSLSETRTGHAEAGTSYAERTTLAAARCRNPTAQAQAAYATGIWQATTDPRHAREALEHSEALAREVGNLWFELFARTETLWLRAHETQTGAVLSAFADVVAAWHRGGDWANQWLSLRHVFGICCLLRADELAVIIHGALERAGAVDAFPFDPSAAADNSIAVDELHGRLGDRRFQHALQQGRTTSTPVVIDLIVSQLRALGISSSAESSTE